MAATAIDRLSLLPTELRLELYDIIFPPRQVLQIRRQWLSFSTVSHADLWRDSNYLGLRQGYREYHSDHWPPHIEDAYLEATMVAKPDGKRRRNKIISVAIYKRSGKERNRKQVSSHYSYYVNKAIAPIPTAVRVFHSRGCPRLQPLPRHFHRSASPLELIRNRSTSPLKLIKTRSTPPIPPHLHHHVLAHLPTIQPLEQRG